MACSSKPGVKPFLDYIEAVTGEKITQADWHDIRELTVKELHIEGKLSKKVANEPEVLGTFRILDADINSDDSYEGYDDALVGMQGKPATEGTLLAVQYLALVGVKDTLGKVRLARSARNKGIDTEGLVPTSYFNSDGEKMWEYNLNVKTENVDVDSYSLEEVQQYELYKMSAGDGTRSVAAFHELERRALPDLAELRSSYDRYPADALEQPTPLYEKLAPAMREFERVRSNPEAPREDLERLASLVSDAAEDANYHTFNSWFMERSRKDGFEIEYGAELRRKDERAFQRLIEEAGQQG